MNTIQKTFNDLAAVSNIAGNLAVLEGQPSVSIAQPIDLGADKLLSDYKNAWLTYPPLEVEYLIQTLNEHLNNCLEIRLKAQELEVKAFSETNDQLMQRNLLEELRSQIKLITDNEPKLLANMINPKYQSSTGAVAGDQNLDYWKELFKIQEAQLKIKINDADNRLNRLNEVGSGNNYVSRFEFLKKLFEVDLIEAYCRARAAAVGLKSIYNIDIPVPVISDHGYLDKLTLWARNVTYELEKKFFNVREVTVAVALNDSSVPPASTVAPVYDIPRIMTMEAFRATRSGGTFTFSIKDDLFDRLNLKLKNPRLKGLDVSVISNDVNKQPLYFWRIFVKPPTKKINIATGVPSYSYEPTVFIPMATYPAHTADLNIVPNQREVNNVNPVGEWTIRIEPKNIFASVDTNVNENVDNLLIRMRIAYDKD